MAWDAGSITNAAPWATLSGKVQALCGTTGVENWQYVTNVPAGTLAGQSGNASYTIDVFRCRGASTLYKRAVQINLSTQNSTTDGTSFVFTLTSPIATANRFFTLFIYNSKASSANDPSTVTVNGSNGPTFTKIKSQLGGNVGEINGTLWIGKTGGSTPSGVTQLTVDFGGGNTQTGCGIMLDQWDGCDLTLSVSGVDSSGSTQVGIQVVGNNGTTETAHSATLSAFLGPKSIAVTWAAEANGTGNYTAGVENGWTGLTTAESTYATPTVHARGMVRPDQDDVTGTLTLSVATSETSWCCISFEFQRTTDLTSVTNPNDSGRDWYWLIYIPVADGAVSSFMTCMEDFDLNYACRRPCALAASTAPQDTIGYWRSNTFATPATVTGVNSQATGTLNTSGFSYWIKMTKNSILISTRVGVTEATNGATLVDSFLTNTTDRIPLHQFTGGGGGSTTGCTFSNLPGVTVGPANTWKTGIIGWTDPVVAAFTNNSANANDLWASNKIHVARVLALHQPGITGTQGSTSGIYRGLWKTDFLCFATGGTVNYGDTMTISSNTWTVVCSMNTTQSGTIANYIVTRAN